MLPLVRLISHMQACHLIVNLDEAELLQSPGAVCLELGPFLAESLGTEMHELCSV